MVAKPGAMIAFITSRYTLDSTQNNPLKELIKNNCEFAGAIGLPAFGDETFLNPFRYYTAYNEDSFIKIGKHKNG